MAIDNKDKRFSMLNFGGECLLLPDPDGSFDRSDRYQLLDLYGRIQGPDLVSLTLTITQTATALTQTIDQAAAQDRTIVQSIPLTMER